MSISSVGAGLVPLTQTTPQPVTPSTPTGNSRQIQEVKPHHHGGGGATPSTGPTTSTTTASSTGSTLNQLV